MINTSSGEGGVFSARTRTTMAEEEAKPEGLSEHINLKVTSQVSILVAAQDGAHLLTAKP